MTIGINIDGVLRNYLEKFISTHKKYYKSEVKIEDIIDYDIEKYFSFEGDENMEPSSFLKFSYEDCSLEIYGSADEIEEYVVTKLNNFISNNQEKIKVKLLTRECGRAIPSTLFFLSKTGSMCKNIKFVSSYEDMWEECDILVTTFPKSLETKPKDKISVKVERHYNKKINSDYAVKTLTEFLEEEYINKIINTETVEHKEL
jgi:hypothetical protein|tara:strand:- start:225 stop:830 length:606 start_codon:yes stop_codon:yes gene_type:complete